MLCGDIPEPIGHHHHKNHHRQVRKLQVRTKKELDIVLIENMEFF
jgi:hypothetical protein